MHAAAITAWDWMIVAAYAAVVVVIATWSNRRQKSADDYMLAGRSLPWWVIGISIIATSFSTISLLGWTGKGYAQGAQWVQFQLGELAAILVVCALFLPFFSRLPLTTAYEYLEGRFGRTARLVASLAFHVQVVARAGLFLYVTAEALTVFTEDIALGLDECIVIVGVASMLYSSVGGLGAVVWTDALQMAMVLVGVTWSLLLVIGRLPGGLADVAAVMEAPGQPPLIDWSLSLDKTPTVLSAVLAYGVLALSVAGTNQQPVQRYLACRDLGAARRAALLSWAVGLLVVLLTLGLGVVLRAWYGDTAIPTDKVFPTFVAAELPAGIAGLLVAAIFAASMSSIDSAVHSMSTATLVDFIEPARRRPLEPRTRLRLARLLTLAHGVLAVSAAFIASRQGRDIVDLLLLWLGFLAGPVLGLFLLGMLTRSIRERHALIGVGVGYVVAMLLNTTWLTAGDETLAQQIGVHGIWTACVCCLVTLVVASSAAAVDRSHTEAPPEDASGL